MLIFILVPALSAGGLLWLLRGPKIPPWLDLACAVALLLISAMFLGMIESIKTGLPAVTAGQRNMVVQYQVALYLVPFFTAAIATNIVSNVLLHNRDYKGTLSLRDASKAVAKGIFFSILVLSVFGVVFYGLWAWWRDRHGA